MSRKPGAIQLLETTELAGNIWRNQEKLVEDASDEVWIDQMYEIDRLEGQYRAYQDQIIHHLKQAVKDGIVASE